MKKSATRKKTSMGDNARQSSAYTPEQAYQILCELDRLLPDELVIQEGTQTTHKVDSTERQNDEVSPVHKAT